MDVKYHLQYLPEALQDLDEIGTYLFRATYGDAAIADKVVAVLRREIKKLETINYGHRYTASPWYEQGVMTVAIRRYRVFYWRDEAQALIYVLRIIHGARNVDQIVSESGFGALPAQGPLK